MKCALTRCFGTSRLKVPGIALDINGVLRKGSHPIPGANKAIQMLKTPLKNLSKKFGKIHSSLPFILMSNSGGYLEYYKAADINKILGLQETQIQSNDLLLCHTPLRDLVSDYKDSYVIVTGIGDVLSVATNYGFSHAITLEEYSALFPYLSRNAINGKTSEHVEYLALRARQRLQNEFSSPPPIDAVFVMSDPLIWDENFQIICDLLISKNGIPGNIRKQNDPQHVKFYITNDDIVYADTFILPRYSQGSFLLCLEQLFNRQYHISIETIKYGKPKEATFEFAEKMLQRKSDDSGFEISQYYMIGDNPFSDIQGANLRGWKSILVQTGLFKGPENDKKNPATYIKKDVLEAIQFIFSNELSI